MRLVGVGVEEGETEPTGEGMDVVALGFDEVGEGGVPAVGFELELEGGLTEDVGGGHGGWWRCCTGGVWELLHDVGLYLVALVHAPPHQCQAIKQLKKLEK